MASLPQITAILDSLLEISQYRDASLNGLQVEATPSEVKRVALAVDSGISVIERAVAERADMLIVHHGLMWGRERPLRGALGRKVRLLIENGCSLYAAHLPLDGHLTLGNGALLAQHLGLHDIVPSFQLDGMPVGVRARCPHPTALDILVRKCAALRPGTPPLVLPFGPKEVTRVGIVTGSGCSLIDPLEEGELDLFLTGEPKQSAYHELKERGINGIFAGHYATETFGVRALGIELERQCGVESVFIDEETGI